MGCRGDWDFVAGTRLRVGRWHFVEFSPERPRSVGWWWFGIEREPVMLVQGENG